jgi:hypothetical protein
MAGINMKLILIKDKHRPPSDLCFPTFSQFFQGLPTFHYFFTNIPTFP